MKRTLLLLSVLLQAFFVCAQQRIDSNFAFQTDPAKKYSLYIPSGYNSSTPSKMIVGLHGSSASENSSKLWCNILKDFVENNNLLLACPDGDGNLNQQIDVDFTAALIDSMKNWYNVNAQKIFTLGYSSGTLVTYSWGLDNANIFAGYITIANIASPSQVKTKLPKANGKPIFMLHGDSDNPSINHVRLRDSLIAHGACVGDSIMSGVGHTGSPPHKEDLYTYAYKYVDTACGGSTGIGNIATSTFNVQAYPTTIRSGDDITIELPNTQKHNAYIYNSYGQIILAKELRVNKKASIQVAAPPGIYYLQVTSEQKRSATLKLVVL